MKKLLFAAVASLILSSCSFQTAMCPTYGHNNDLTKFGNKAQARYIKHSKNKI